MENIRQLYAQTALWHGTGRYKYDENGKVADVLAGIIRDGGLKPHDDDWDPKRGKIQSISLAPARMYAKLYAWMHIPRSARPDSEHRSCCFYGYYFFCSAAVVAYAEYLWRPHIPDYRAKLKKWTGKVSRKPHTLKSVFVEGTDIPDNYPILIGIKCGVVKPNRGSRFFDLHETRSEKSIAMSDLTHFEVPADRVDETASSLRVAGFDTPVIPIEDGEAYCRQFSFWQLVSGELLESAVSY
jgi:hypothetical protein